MSKKQKLNTAYGAASEMNHITKPDAQSVLLLEYGRLHFNTSRIVDENDHLAHEINRLLAQNNFLIQRIDSLVSECNDLDRLKAKNLDLKRKLRDARSEVTRYQREYIDLLERRGEARVTDENTELRRQLRVARHEECGNCGATTRPDTSHNCYDETVYTTTTAS